MASPAKSPVVQTLRMLVGSVVAALFLMSVALLFVLGLGAPPLWSVLVLLLLGAAMYALIEAVGYRATPISPQLPADQAHLAAVGAFRTSLMLRLALAESVALIALVLAFVAGHTVLVFDVGAAVSVLLLAVHVWPSIRTIDRVVGHLEKDGAQSGLRELMGFGGTSDGPVTRLG